MSKQQDKYAEVVKAAKELERTWEDYKAIIFQFVSISPVVTGQPAPSPKRVLNAKGLEELKQAELKNTMAKTAFQKAIDEYYKARG
jgi:hypothetical protein